MQTYTIRRDEDGIRIVSPDEMRDEKIAQGKDPDKAEGRFISRYCRYNS